MLSQVNSTSFFFALAIAIPWFVAVWWLAQRLNREKTDKVTAPAALFTNVIDNTISIGNCDPRAWGFAGVSVLQQPWRQILIPLRLAPGVFIRPLRRTMAIVQSMEALGWQRCHRS